MSELKSIKNIAIRIPNWIGDAVLSTPFLYFARKYLPESKIYIIMREKVKDVFLHNPWYDKIITIKGKGIFNNIREGIELRKNRFDLFFVLPDSFSSALNAYFTGAKVRVGYKKECRNIMLNLRLNQPDRVIHRTYKYLNILKEFLSKYCNIKPYVIEKDFKRNAKVHIFLTKQELQRGKRLLKSIRRKIIGINPNASAQSRRWFKERFAQLADKIIKELKYNVIFFGSKEEKNYVCNLLKLMTQKAYNLAGKINLREYIAILKHLDLFITNDTGPMHLANAVGTPVIAIEGAADVRETGMFNKNKRIYINKHLSCSPCVRNVCPYNYECLYAIEVSDVFKSVKKILQK